MQVITPQQVTPAIRAMCDSTMPAAFRGGAVLDGNSIGKIWTDDAAKPSWCVIQEGVFGTLYLGGEVTASVLDQVIREVRPHSEVMIGLWPDDPRIDFVPSQCDYRGTVLDFRYRPPLQGLDAYVRDIPAGCTFRRVDEHLFQRSMDYDWYSRVFGSPAKALGDILGLFLMRDDQILCEAYAGVSANGIIEMGVNTMEGHRQRGYATLTCARLIYACEALGYQTYWNCNSANTASAALARKLGYRLERPYTLFYWEGTDTTALDLTQP
jgi:RimJ/RimL family protein N-acetyltransferase